jgi:hypothetical protein
MAKYLCNTLVDPENFDTYEESVAIYYNKSTNRFEDDDGYPIFDIYRIISPNDFYMFMHKKEYMITNHQSLSQVFVEMYYPTEGEDNDECE